MASQRSDDSWYLYNFRTPARMFSFLVTAKAIVPRLNPFPTPSLSKASFHINMAHLCCLSIVEKHLGSRAAVKASLHGLNEVGRQTLAKLSNVGAIDLDVLAKHNIDNSVVEEEEILGNLRGARVLGRKGSDESCWLAVVIESKATALV